MVEKLSECMGIAVAGDTLKACYEAAARACATMAEATIIALCREKNVPGFRGKIDSCMQNVNKNSKTFKVNVQGLLHPKVVEEGTSRALGSSA